MPPVRPPDLPPFGDLETPPPPPPPTFPPSPVPTPGFATPPPSFDPLAPLATPNPRPELGDEQGAGETGERSGSTPSNEDDPSQQLIDLTGDGTGSNGAPGGAGDGEPNVLAASIAKLARTAGEAVKTFAFPLSLTVLVVIFLLIQGEIDRRDPKLAFAPVDSSKDMVHFE